MHEKQHCSKYWNSTNDIKLVERMVYYVMGTYKESNSKQIIEKDLQELMNLSQNQTGNLSLTYINKGFFNTDELVLLNGTEHRSNFVGPYTACLRLLLSKLPGVSGNATLREDLMLFNNDLA